MDAQALGNHVCFMSRITLPGGILSSCIDGNKECFITYDEILKMSFVTSFAERNYHFIVFIVRRRGFIMMRSPHLINERNLHYISVTINTPSLLTHRPPIHKHTKIHLVSSPTAMKHHHDDRALMLKHRVTSSNMAGLDGMIRGLPWSY